MLPKLILCLCIYTAWAQTPASEVTTTAKTEEEPPEGYYAFVESPEATPPRVRPPPYVMSGTRCSTGSRPAVSASNLCGDLNRGLVPNNPMGHSPNGEPYPFDLIRNHTLRFLSRALPVLRADDALPRVRTDKLYTPEETHRQSRALENDFPSSSLPLEHRSLEEETPRARGFCENGGVFCMLYRAINGGAPSSDIPSLPSKGGVERREDPATVGSGTPQPRYEGPPTPCPARVEYATPVFARNYQGVWRYVVQIPYEGYFTQTIEVTRCLQSRCHYLDGGCLSSPRWVSLLVAEIHYPNEAKRETVKPTATPQPENDNSFQEYHQYLQKRAARVLEPTTEKPTHCDGHDDMGCYQVRLYYDWFLVPGSCKCWRPDYFARYVRRKQQTNEL